MQEFLEQYGYLALMVGTFLEGETAILVASSLVHNGLFKIPSTVFFAFAGAFISDWLYYSIGYFNGKYYLAKRPKLEAKVLPVQRFMHKNSTQVLLIYRFLYGFRIIIPITIGLCRIPPRTFLIFSIISGVIWASVVSGIGYLAGAIFNIDSVVLEKNIFFIVTGFAIIGLFMGFLVKKIANSRINQN
jgi:membrane protein DedA with SNARE-associated domain